MPQMMRGLTIAAALLLTIAAGPQNVSVPVTPVPGSRMPDRPFEAVLARPDGTSPFPVVILLHGCSGISPGQQFWVDRLTGWGYAVLRLDSFSARGITDVCAPNLQPFVTPVDRAGDVLSAALWLRTQPFIDGVRIGVLGESHGGGTAVAVTRAVYEDLYPGLLKAAVDYYGPCRTPNLHGKVPLLALAGDADTWSFPMRTCEEFASQLRSDQPMQVVVYPGAVHSFDNPNLRRLIYKLGHPMAYDGRAAEDSFAKVKAFLDRYVRGSAG
jgi:dienelactone hydrolase